MHIRRCFRRRHGRGDGLKVLAFMAAGDLMANTPIDFLLEGSDMELISVYVDTATQILPDLPAHDVAFVAVGESEANEPVLRNLQRLLLFEVDVAMIVHDMDPADAFPVQAATEYVCGLMEERSTSRNSQIAYG